MADPVIRLINLELEAKPAEALHSLPGHVAINLKCMVHNVIRQPSERVEIDGVEARRWRRWAVPQEVGIAGLLEMELTGHLGVAANPSHLDVALEPMGAGWGWDTK